GEVVVAAALFGELAHVLHLGPHLLPVEAGLNRPAHEVPVALAPQSRIGNEAAVDVIRQAVLSAGGQPHPRPEPDPLPPLTPPVLSLAPFARSRRTCCGDCSANRTNVARG